MLRMQIWRCQALSGATFAEQFWHAACDVCPAALASASAASLNAAPMQENTLSCTAQCSICSVPMVLGHGLEVM